VNKWRWDRFFSKQFGFSLSLSFRQCCMSIHLPITRNVITYQLTVSLSSISRKKEHGDWPSSWLLISLLISKPIKRVNREFYQTSLSIQVREWRVVCVWFLLHTVTADCLFRKFLAIYKNSNGLCPSLGNPSTQQISFFPPISLHIFIPATSGSPKYSAYINFGLIFCSHLYYSYPTFSLFILSSNNNCLIGNSLHISFLLKEC